MKSSLLWLGFLFSLPLNAQTVQYQLDAGHTYIGFDVERFLVGEVSGRFNKFSAVISMQADDLSSSQAEVVIQASSLDSNNDIRDGHLRGELWLDTATHPEIHFKSTAIDTTENGELMMSGDFTIKGVTQMVRFPVEILGPFTDPTQHVALGFKADFSINRFDYGIAFDRQMEEGVPFIGEEVKIKIRALAYQI
ncbi:MAG: YceI family protein [Bacteroidota bacterium]